MYRAIVFVDGSQVCTYLDDEEFETYEEAEEEVKSAIENHAEDHGYEVDEYDYDITEV